MATLKDVAKASGLTVGTVSRVLNNRGYISDKTREKVYQVMKELNYQPNETARALSKQKSNTIGVILPNIEHPYFAKVLSRLEREAARQGYRIRCVKAKEWPVLFSAVEALRLRSLKDWIFHWSHWSVLWMKGRPGLSVITIRAVRWRQSCLLIRAAGN